MQIVSRFVNKINSFAGNASAIMLVAIVLFVFGNSLSRILGYPLKGLFELTILGMVFMTFIGSGYALKENAHIRVDTINPYLKSGTSDILEVIINAIILIYSVFLLRETYSWLCFTVNVGMRTGETTLPIPMWVLALIMSMGFLFLSLQAIVSLSNSCRDVFTLFSTSDFKMFVRPLLIVLCIIIAIALSYLYLSPVAAIFITLIALIFARLPVSFAIGISGIITLYGMVGSERIGQVPTFMLHAVQSWPLTAAPLFIFGGMVMGEAKIVENIFKFIEYFFARLPSPLLIATIVTGGIFCSITGSSIAATAVVGSLCLPLLLEKGYNKELSIGVVAGSTVGTLIPPSTAFIMYAVITGVSLGQTFMAGIGPAVLLFGFYIVYVVMWSVIKKEKREEAEDTISRTKIIYFWRGLPAILAPVIILGGIYLGLYTPTEGGGVFAAYALVCGILGRNLNWAKVKKVTLESVGLSLMLLFIVANADVYSKALVLSRIVHELSLFIQQVTSSAPVFLIVVFFFLVVCGMFMDALSMTVITLPVLFPVATSLGVDPLFFAVYFIIAGEIALRTPPVGVNIFIIQGVTKMPYFSIVRGTIPFFVMMILTLVIIYLVPSIVTWLPSIMY
ncbi:MAG: TRAP transporter large permease subunit [Dethiobacteria bacterium]